MTAPPSDPVRRRLGLRGRLWLAAVGVIALVLALLTLGFNLVLRDRLDHQASGRARDRATAELAALSVGAGGARLAETADQAAIDAPVWVFNGSRSLERPAASPTDQRTAAALSRGPRRFLDSAGAGVRFYAQPIVYHGRRVGTIVAAVSLRSGAQTARTALVASIVLALVALVAVALVSRWLISRALAPVAEMTATAAVWSEHDLDRRFALGTPHDELTELAAVLDRLLERLAAGLRREQRLTAELAHELRTPLAQIAAEAQFALRHASGAEEARAGHAQILATARQMSATIETLLTAARAQLEAARTSDARAGARAAVDACRPLAEARGITIEASDWPAPIVVAVEAALVERILAPVLENGCRYARRAVTVDVRRNDGRILYVLADDGPGIAASPVEAIFEPGHRDVDAERAPAGAGLGLALARRLARAAGGEVTAATSSHGATFTVALPGARPA